MKIIKVPIEKCELWDKNPRGITKKDFERLKKQIQKLGVYKPLIACQENGKYIILGGNMRLRALQELGYKDVELSIVEAKTEKEKIEYSLSDNDRVGYYEEEKLAELIYPEIGNLDLSLFKVDVDNALSLEKVIEEFAPDLEGVSSGEGLGNAERVLDAGFSRSQLAHLLGEDLASIKDVKKTMLDVVSLSEQAYQFNRLCAGYRCGNFISLLFTPHRLDVETGRKGVPERFPRAEAMNLAEYYVRLQKKITRQSWVVYEIFRTGMGGYQMAKEFPPSIARNLIFRYYPKEKSVRVLDPCHGWGGRLIGSLSTLKQIYYLGVDPCKRTSDGVRALADFLLSAEHVAAAGSQVELICAPFEESEIEGEFDIAITSPPYYDTEQYEPGDEKQAGVRYRSYEEFEDGFLRILISKTIEHLKPGAPFIINVGNTRYDMLSSVRKLCSQMGLSCRAIEPPMPIGGMGLGRRTSVEEEDIVGEPFLEIKKDKKK